jgi:hypothetical protein
LVTEYLKGPFLAHVISQEQEQDQMALALGKADAMELQIA